MSNVGFFLIGFVMAVPTILYPLLFPGKADRALPLSQRYVVKANIWIAIFSYVGNFYYTHLFFEMANASYSFPTTWMLNHVPIFLYLITHAYFTFYHTVTNIVLRRFWSSANPSSFVKGCILVAILAWITAFMEAFTIQAVPYYSFADRSNAYIFGSMVYGVYFIVSFPMFLRLDERVSDSSWTISKTIIDSLGASMLVLILLDLLKIFLNNFWFIGSH